MAEGKEKFFTQIPDMISRSGRSEGGNSRPRAIGLAVKKSALARKFI